MSDDFLYRVKSYVTSVWDTVMGHLSHPDPVKKEDALQACEEAAGEMQSKFCTDDPPSMDHAAIAARQAGIRSIATGELHKAYQLSRSAKIKAAVNTVAFIVRDKGGLDIMKGRIYEE